MSITGVGGAKRITELAAVLEKMKEISSARHVAELTDTKGGNKNGSGIKRDRTATD